MFSKLSLHLFKDMSFTLNNIEQMLLIFTVVFYFLCCYDYCEIVNYGAIYIRAFIIFFTRAVSSMLYFLMQVSKLVPTLQLVHTDACQLKSTIAFTQQLANTVSARVRHLDTAKVHWKLTLLSCKNYYFSHSIIIITLLHTDYGKI